MEPADGKDEPPASADVRTAVLQTLVERDEGMTVFEIRCAVDADIDAIESALGSLNERGRIVVDDTGARTVISPAENGERPAHRSAVDRLRDRLRTRLPDRLRRR